MICKLIRYIDSMNNKYGPVNKFVVRNGSFIVTLALKSIIVNTWRLIPKANEIVINIQLPSEIDETESPSQIEVSDESVEMSNGFLFSFAKRRTPSMLRILNFAGQVSVDSSRDTMRSITSSVKPTSLLVSTLSTSLPSSAVSVATSLPAASNSSLALISSSDTSSVELSSSSDSESENSNDANSVRNDNHQVKINKSNTRRVTAKSQGKKKHQRVSASTSNLRSARKLNKDNNDNSLQTKKKPKTDKHKTVSLGFLLLENCFDIAQPPPDIVSSAKRTGKSSKLGQCCSICFETVEEGEDGIWCCTGKILKSGSKCKRIVHFVCKQIDVEGGCVICQQYCIVCLTCIPNKGAWVRCPDCSIHMHVGCRPSGLVRCRFCMQMLKGVEE